MADYSELTKNLNLKVSIDAATKAYVENAAQAQALTVSLNGLPENPLPGATVLDPMTGLVSVWSGTQWQVIQGVSNTNAIRYNPNGVYSTTAGSWVRPDAPPTDEEVADAIKSIKQALDDRPEA